jgi:DNA-directed RNA polymerase alpha subunit
MNLSVRALNCLKAADVETLGDLVQFNKTDLLSSATLVRNRSLSLMICSRV